MTVKTHANPIIIENYETPCKAQILAELETIQTILKSDITADTLELGKQNIKAIQIGISNFKQYDQQVQNALMATKKDLTRLDTDNKFTELRINNKTFNSFFNQLLVDFIPIKENTEKITEEYETSAIPAENKSNKLINNELMINSLRNQFLQGFNNHHVTELSGTTSETSSLEPNWKEISSNEITSPISNSVNLLNSTATTRNEHIPFEKECERLNQMASTTKFFNNFIKDYCLSFVVNDNSDVNNCLLEKIQRQWHNIAGPSLFFRTPENILETHKSLIINILNSSFHFFCDYNKFKANTKQPLDDTQLAITLLHNLGIPTENLQPTNDFLTQKICEQSTSLLNKILDCDSEDLWSFIISSVFIPIIFNKVISPYLFALITDNLFLQDARLPPINDASTSSSNPQDVAFNSQFSLCIQKIIQEMATLGNAQGTCSLALSVIGKMSGTIGTFVYQSLNKVFNTDSLAIPIFILEKILYKDEKPLMTIPFNKSEEEKLNYRNDVQKRFKEKLYSLIYSNKPSAAQLFLNYCTSIEDFCNTLSEELFKITQNEYAYKLFVLYLLTPRRPQS